jgi:5'-nucleotidase / UDP-sugar diphosphatase
MNSSLRYYFRFFCASLWISSITLILFAQPKTLTILHTNDMHAGFLPHDAFWIKGKPKPLIGGFNELSFAIDSIRRVKPATLVLDAGDVMTGNPITEYPYAGVSGGVLFAMMNQIGYDAWTPGNHDFDYTPENLRKLTSIANFPTVSANVLDTLNNFPVNNKEYIVIEKNGMKIGIIGAMSSEFYELVSKNSTVGIKILPPIETVKRLAEQLKSQTDLLIALTHEGVDYDSILAENVPQLNVIVGGHSHTKLIKPKIVNDVIIVQTGFHCENLGILDMTVENHRIVSYNGSLLPLWYNSARKSTPLSIFIDSMKNEIDRDYAVVLAELKNDWINNHSENAMGNFIADAHREAAGADVGFMNTAGIRKNMSAGPITKRDLFEILPFRNILMKFKLTGKHIKSIVEYYIDGHPNIQTSGITCEWRHKLNGSIEFKTFLVNGKPLDENKVYIGAASDYLLGEAKKYLGIEVPDMTSTNLTVFSIVENKLMRMKEIQSGIGYRIHRME